MNKSTSSRFRGFADFAQCTDFVSSGSTTAAASLAAARAKKTKTAKKSANQQQLHLTKSPTYTGSNAQLSALFRKIGQKRDPTTKVRALEELTSAIYPPFSSSWDESCTESLFPRPEKIAALSHLVFLHESKLGYDNNASVRAASYAALAAARNHVPKAWRLLLLSKDEIGREHLGVLGMAWGASHGDPSLEVSMNASSLTKELMIADTATENIDSPGREMQIAICNYSTILLECKRPSSLHELINPTPSIVSSTSSLGSGLPDDAVSRAVGINTSEREEMEERYDRSIRSVLIGLGCLFECCPETEGESYAMIFHTSPIARLLTSNRGSFRRESYKLVGQICQFAPSLLASIAIGNRIPSLLTLEKEPVNLVSLLEMTLSYLATKVDHRPTEEMIHSELFTKSLIKILRRGCYGAPATSWGPTILPILASLPEAKKRRDDDGNEGKPLSLQVISSLWDSRKSVAGITDTIAIVSAVAECATFFMIRPIGEDLTSSISTKSWIEYGLLFLDVLSYYLIESPEVIGTFDSVITSSVNELCKTLARDLNKLDVASGVEIDKAVRGITIIKSWLWGEEGLQRTLFVGQDFQERTTIIRKWTALLERLSSSSDRAISNLIPACKTMFHSIVNYRPAGNATCSVEEEQLLWSILQRYGVGSIFPMGGLPGENMVSLVERFCVNDLLRWILNHALTCSVPVEVDFQILKLCLHSIHSLERQRKIWEIVLHELIGSYSNYSTFAVGLKTLTSDCLSGADLTPVLRCDVLDKFAIDTAEQVIGSFRRTHVILQLHGDLVGASNYKHRGDASYFLRACVGLLDSPSDSPCVLVVSPSVIEHWINLCCGDTKKKLGESIILEDKAGKNILLKTLLDMSFSSNGKNAISHKGLVKLTYESWLEGGKTWNEYSTEVFLAAGTIDYILRDQVVSIAASSLVDDVNSEAPCDRALLELICQSWASRASRLIAIHPCNDLGLVGLSNIDTWDKAVLSEEANQSDFLFLCLMYLLHSIGDNNRGHILVIKSLGAELFLQILTCISKTNSPFLVSFESRVARNHQLVETLGGKDVLEDSILEDYCLKIIDMLSTLMRNTRSRSKMNRSITSLSLLLSLLFPIPFAPDYGSLISNDDITKNVKEGDSCWYMKKGEPSDSVKATVVKIHRDDFPNLYFTIREEDTIIERQTVASRLQWDVSPTKRHEVLLPDEYDNVYARRELVGRCIVDKLVAPFFGLNEEDAADRARAEGAAESINVIVSQCGLVLSGISSIRYEIFHTVSSMEQGLSNVLSTSEHSIEKCTKLLRRLSLAMGYGVFSASSPNNVLALKMKSIESIIKILDLYDKQAWVDAQKADPMEAFHTSVLMWIATSVSTVTDKGILRRVFFTIHTISCILSPLGNLFSMRNSLHILNAAFALRFTANHCIGFSSHDNDDEKNILCTLTYFFIKVSPSDCNEYWINTFSSLLEQTYKHAKGTIVSVVASFSNVLCDCLFDPVKRWCAFRLLRIFTDTDNQSLQGDNVIPREIEKQLFVWKKELDEEEAVELFEDVSASLQWLPIRMMVLLQNIKNCPSSTQSNRQVLLMGKLLLWITFLDILEVAGFVDMRNRSHISSYIRKTNSLGYIMNLAFEEATLDIDPSENIFLYLDREADLLLQDVATLAVFKTVESLPTLVKTWYSDDCPSCLSQKVSTFIENVVAPSILKRELSRIRDATSFGEMRVVGSCVSREIVATYHQDECQLSVTVKVPSCFPLRNVEVDCQKTVGISENRWRRWALQIMLMLNNQDGTILDCLLLWKKNVDKEFDGVEPCPVCYSVLCIKTHQMPNLECRTCHNRFHTTCLMKWFQSSGKSQCVICQQPWSRV